ncbi:hypothetical protein [Hymenobacter cellulosivorans]|uniref:Lipoprotein n=1 Tax=Hymenobacter cellulosivorans TaxID=2932249 RepID=A0ABY4F451_9BACT|nr:hypothetical protein [Hymenobacter cellulosivorans]UOQ51411.1 hypothetical protein MUN80_16775 [Hymenobacter cellulosivorans]
MKNILYCSLCMLMAACTSPNSKAGPDSNLKQSHSPTVTHKTKLTNFAVIPSIDPDPISDAELDQVADLLQLCVTEYNVKAERDFRAKSDLPYPNGHLSIFLAEYRKQLVVSVNSKGVKTVWVNCFCESVYEDYPNWKKEINPLDVNGGGLCYFNVRLNLTEGTWGKLDINSII